ncbi:uncharacterized protein LOC105182114 [Harpegnathos saltator]|uniref:uncharacterized protein LOC105182114 n=1 Tax=Harpegnathos saltator TaxID=610380 RepID=UPI00058C27ED|nr:uncharacterized protein LOC105182114 [Harpegnathos saltator]
MKILSNFVFILVIMVLVHGYDPKRARKFQQNIMRCNQKLNNNILNGDTFICVLEKYSKIFDENGLFILDEVLSLIWDVIPKRHKATMAFVSFKKCYDELSTENITANQTSKIMECSLPILPQLINNN